ncbi:unnamed protein product [Heligmosomoides polygyrus]|uniref:G protein-coupled receptor n=1 Tax=Heligmosomoides polygyrus TaxID=6339 RepID=A0A183GKR6_HELPZ|nr:unnamed protein product [Heligmosomoides polygyrus]
MELPLYHVVVVYVTTAVSFIINTILIFFICKHSLAEFGRYKALMLTFTVFNIAYSVVQGVTMPIIFVVEGNTLQTDGLSRYHGRVLMCLEDIADISCGRTAPLVYGVASLRGKHKMPVASIPAAPGFNFFVFFSVCPASSRGPLFWCHDAIFPDPALDQYGFDELYNMRPGVVVKEYGLALTMWSLQTEGLINKVIHVYEFSFFMFTTGLGSVPKGPDRLLTATFCSTFAQSLFLITLHFLYRYVQVVRPQWRDLFEKRSYVTLIVAIYVFVAIDYGAVCFFNFGPSPVKDVYFAEQMWLSYGLNISAVGYLGPIYMVRH